LETKRNRRIRPRRRLPRKRKKQGRRGIIRWFKDIISELKKVTWPSRKDLFNYTLAVIAVIAVAAILVGAIDFGLGRLFRLVMGS